MAEPALKNVPKEICRRHAKWVKEALASGAAKPLELGALDGAFARGMKRAAARKAAKRDWFTVRFFWRIWINGRHYFPNSKCATHFFFSLSWSRRL